MCVKDVKIYFIGLKKDLFGCFKIEEIRDQDNETGLKEEGGIEMSTTVLSMYAMHALPFAFCIYTDLLLSSFKSEFTALIAYNHHALGSCNTDTLRGRYRR